MGKCIAFTKNTAGVMMHVNGATKWLGYPNLLVTEKHTPVMIMVLFTRWFPGNYLNQLNYLLSEPVDF